MAEKHLYNEIRLALTPLGVRLFRNNTGMLRDVRGIPVRFGLCVGSSDLIGWTPCIIAGQPTAVFTAIEVKDRGKPTDEQTKFILAVRAAGGIAGVARNASQAVDLIHRGLRERGITI
jgi:hypothetical protein